MEFIKTMKKREFIEMGLKTLAAMILAFIAIILMEGMIYSVTLNAYKTKAEKSVSTSTDSVVYCMETDKETEDGDDLYFVLCHNVKTDSWSASSGSLYTEDYIENVLAKKEIVWHAPSAFTFTINPVHYVVMAVFMAGVAGFFVWRFIKLSKSYKEIETTFEKTGTIEISNK